MAKPDPQGGLVIRYDYLWLWEEERGRRGGAKDRPCAVVVAVPAQGSKPGRAVVCGITHKEPRSPDDGIEVPQGVKRHLKLDADRSWIITSEANMVDWDDPGIIPTPAGDWAYGFVPPVLAEAIRKAVLSRHDGGTLHLLDRTNKPEG
jgi:hypothetical protein